MSGPIRLACLLFFSLAVSVSQAYDGEGKGFEHSTGAGAGGGGPYASKNVALLSHLELNQMGAGNGVLGSDIWGWADAGSGRKFALVGLTNMTSFVEVTNPTAPVFLGTLNTHFDNRNEPWRDIKVYNNHAFIVADGGGNNHGMQVFDLRQLLTSSQTTPQTFSETNHYGGFSSAHNIAINEGSGFAYVVGESRGGRTGGGLHILDIRNPGNITEAAVYSAGGYTHDAQAVMYSGPDARYANREIVFAANESNLTIVDVTNKSSMATLSQTTYQNSGYAHQGWLSDDQRYYFMDDELDEYYHIRGADGVLGTPDDNPPEPTRTFIWDLLDLQNPVNIGFYEGTEKTIDHNLYVKDGLIYQANYTSGMRILKMTDVANGLLEEVAFFDTYMADNDVTFNGAWSVFPYFDNGTILISDRQGGLFVVQMVPEPCAPIFLGLATLAFGFRRRRS